MRHPFIILADSPGALTDVCGISLLERLLRTLQRLDLTKAVVLSAFPDAIAAHLANPSPHRSKVAIELRRRAPGALTMEQLAAAWPNDAERAIVIRGDSVFDSRLLQWLDDQNSSTGLVDSGPPASLESLVAASAETTRGRSCGAVLLSPQWGNSRDGMFDAVVCEAIDNREIDVLDIADRD